MDSMHRLGLQVKLCCDPSECFPTSIEDMLRYRDSITELSTGPVSVPERDRILNFRYPVLHTLTMETRTNAIYTPTPLFLHIRHFPALTNLILKGTLAPLKVSELAGVRMMKLEYAPAEPIQFITHPKGLLGGLNMWQQLQEIHLINSTPYSQDALSGYPCTSAQQICFPNLRRLFVKDIPSRIANLLPIVQLPNLVSCYLIGVLPPNFSAIHNGTNGHPIFASFFPSPACPISGLELPVEHVILAAPEPDFGPRLEFSTLANSHRLTLCVSDELLPPGDRFSSSHRMRGTLQQHALTSLLHFLHAPHGPLTLASRTQPSTRVSVLTVKAELDNFRDGPDAARAEAERPFFARHDLPLPGRAWDALLGRLPALRALNVDDVGCRAGRWPAELFEALQRAPRRCPQLTGLHVGGLPGQVRWVTEQVERTLRARSRVGGSRRLEYLGLVFAEGTLTHGEEEIPQQTLGGLVDTIRVKTYMHVPRAT